MDIYMRGFERDQLRYTVARERVFYYPYIFLGNQAQSDGFDSDSAPRTLAVGPAWLVLGTPQGRGRWSPYH
jgi:hypothetical protein